MRNKWLNNFFGGSNSIKYVGFWSSFVPEKWLLHQLFKTCAEKRGRRQVCIGPFKLSKTTKLKLKVKAIFGIKADFFITGENRKPRFDLAKKQIGFWRSYPHNPNIIRFPNWMYHIDWPELDNQPPYIRYGMRLKINRLLQPIQKSYGNCEGRLQKAALFATHLHPPRDRLYSLANEVYWL
jgi:hypothetical protein